MALASPASPIVRLSLLCVGNCFSSSLTTSLTAGGCGQGHLSGLTSVEGHMLFSSMEVAMCSVGQGVK